MENSDRDDSLGFDQTLFPTPSAPEKESPQKPSGGAPALDRSLGNFNTLDGLGAASEPPMTDPMATAFFDAAAQFGGGTPVGLSEGLSLGDNYRLDQRLGRGGMGEAWKASDLMANRNVVIKLVPPEIRNAELAMGQVRDTFLKVHALQHQHICPIMGLIEDPNFGAYLVMKFISGKSLDVYRRDYIAEHGRFPATEAIRLLWDVARALDYSHDRKVLHRDVKPQNIMISPEDGVQLIDFGLAAEIRSTMMQVSETPMDMAGTRPYMAPEQWRGRLQDAKTDQYALAVTAYELIAGYLPFQSQDVSVLRECALNEEPEPIPGVADHINAAIRKAMSKKREDRFENCRAFVKAMATKPKEAEKNDPPAAPLPPPPLSEQIDNQLAEALAMPSIKVGEPQAGQHSPKVGTSSIGRFTPQNQSFLWMALSCLSVITLFLLAWIFFGSSKPAANRPDTPAAAASNKAASNTVSNKRDKPAEAAPAAIVVPDTTTGFRSLFDGRSVIRHWRKLDGDWKVENGNIVCRERGTLFSLKEYDNFVLRFDYRLSEGTNNGVLVRAADDGKFDNGMLANGGFEVQILDDSVQGNQATPTITSHGSIYNVEAPKKNNLKPAGQWNSQEIYVNGKDVRVTLNGEVILSTNIQKYSTQINKPKGYIGFKHNSGTIELRNIEIQELTEDSGASASVPRESMPQSAPIVSNPGVISLFDGKSFAGWTGDTDAWRVAHGILHHESAGTIYTKDDFDDFDLTFDFYVEKESNNGLLLRTKEGAAETEVMEVQIAGFGDTGGLFSYLAASSNPTKLGQWNTMAVRYVGTKITTKVNGVTVVDTDLKSTNRPGFRNTKGRIGFMGFGGKSAFRNIEIRPIGQQNNVSSLQLPPPPQDLTTLSDDEKRYLQQKYPELDWTGANIVVVTKVGPGWSAAIYDGFVKASKTKENDIVVVRTTKEKHRANMTAPHVSWKAKDFGSTSIVSLGPEKLIWDGKNEKWRLCIAGQGSQVDFAGIIFTNAGKPPAGHTEWVWGHGAAVLAQGGSTIRLFDCAFIDNVCSLGPQQPENVKNFWTRSGGGVLAAEGNGSLILRDVLFEGNRNNDASDFEGEIPSDKAVCRNSSGGISVGTGGTITATNVVFRNNLGGGMFLNNVKSAELRNISLIGNKSLGHGGGIYINGGDENQTYKLVNIFASGNTCKQYGGGICVTGKGRFLLDHLTLIENHGNNGGGLCLGGIPFINTKEVVLSNSIITGNTGKAVPNFDPQAAPFAPANKYEQLKVYNCILDDWGKTFFPERRSAVTDEQNNRCLSLAAVKLGELTDFGNGVPVRPLLAGSPAIDAGRVVEATPPTDITGRPRKSGKEPDIGAFEWQQSPGESQSAAIPDDRAWLDKFLADHPGLTKADVAPDWVWRNGRITHLQCQNKGITGALDLSPLTELHTADLGRNEITELNISQNTKLKTLWCYTNKLTTLDVSKNTELELLSCNHNQLKALDISKNTKLKTLSCQSNRLTELNLTGTPFSTFRSASRTDQPGGWYKYDFGQDKHMHIDKSVKLLSTDSTTPADSSLGPEMLKVTTFKNGYKPLHKWKPQGDNFDWFWEANHEGKSHGTLSNTSEGLKVVCQSIPPKAGWIPQLTYRPFSLIKGKNYRIEMELRSETGNKATIRVDAWMPKWHQFASKRLHLEKDWKTYSFQFTANETFDKAVLCLHDFEAGGVYEIRRASMREVLPDASTQKNAIPVDPIGPFAKPEKVRFTLEMSEKGEVKFRAEKTDGRQTPAFNGKTVVLPGCPKLDVKTRPDGISRVIYDCRSPLPTPLLFINMNLELDNQAGKLTMRPNSEPISDKNADGWCVFGLNGIMRLPMKISIDATITHRGECCNIEMLCPGSILTCHVYSRGEKVEDDLKVICRIGDKPFTPKAGRVYQDVFSSNFTLKKPYEAVSSVDQLKKDAGHVFRGGIGRNLNRPEGIDIVRSPLEINRISFEGRIDLPK